MVTHEDKVGLSGPKFLFFILRMLTDDIATLSCEVKCEVQDLLVTLKSNSYDILPTIAPQLQTKLVVMCNTGGNLTSMYDHIIMSAFTDLDINEFSSKLSTFTFKMESITVNVGDLKGICAILLLLNEAPRMVKEVKAMKKLKWTIPTKGVKAAKPDKPSNLKDDLIGLNALKTQMANMKYELKVLYSNSSGIIKGGHSTQFQSSNHAYYSRFGSHQLTFTNKNLFNSEEEFNQFRAGAYGKHKVLYSGVYWHCYTKCNHNKGCMGNHPTDRHVDGTKKGTQSLKCKAGTTTVGTPSCLHFAQNA